MVDKKTHIRSWVNNRVKRVMRSLRYGKPILKSPKNLVDCSTDESFLPFV